MLDSPAGAGAMRIAIVGAESTGKTTLAADLADRLARETGQRVTWVPEVLRAWCDRIGRTPEPHEQASILRLQSERIEEAAAGHDIVVCDTTPVMTAVYSSLLFGDHSLQARAAALHRRTAVTLLLALDLPWVADGLQRDGPHVQAPVDELLRRLLMAHGLPFSVIGGEGPARLARAVDAVLPALRKRSGAAGGLFSRLSADADPDENGVQLHPYCEGCSDPGCEQRLRRR